ncbi:hypothetical protein [Streptomyces sp. NPDC047108]|uniref:hypothetical protein n=1 Tax=Streptomyces sp. NPDC047108 TaxID=3155025 RepID=UPI0033F4E881
MVATLVAITALLLAGCSSDSGSDDKIRGAKEADSSNSSRSPSSNANRPKVEVPKGLKMDFEGWTDEDPRIQTVLNDGREGVRAVNEAILQTPSDPNSPNVSFYHSSDALKETKDWISGFKENDLTITGTIRYFDPVVKVRKGGRAAELIYCSDESGGSSKSRKTGKIDDSGTGSNFVQYVTLLQKDSEGVWKAAALEGNRGACS